MSQGGFFGRVRISGGVGLAIRTSAIRTRPQKEKKGGGQVMANTRESWGGRNKG